MKGLVDRFVRAVTGAAKLSPPPFPDSKLPPPNDSIPIALAHHAAGRLEEAETIYAKVLAADPSHFDALHLLGVASLQRGNASVAVDLIRKAVAVDPSNHSAFGNLGAAYRALHRLDHAESALRAALELKPDWEVGHNNLGLVFHAAGKLEAAESCFRAALACNPDYAEALNNLAGIFKDRGQLGEAEALYRRALAVKPDSVESCNNLGSVLQQLGSFAQAEACFRHALTLNPDDAAACNGLGSICQRKGALSEAETWFHKALDADPEMAEAACNLGDVLQGLGRLEEAETWCRIALAQRPDYAEVFNNLGTIFKKRMHFDEAEASYRQALTLDPGHAAAYSNLGILANERYDLDEAELCFRKAMTLDPTSASIRYNLSALTLLRGNYQEGLALYESRFDAFTREFRGSRGLHGQLAAELCWHGEALSGRRILVWTEQGLGDSLMAMRFLPKLRERGAETVIVYCDPALERVIRAMPGVDETVPDTAPPPLDRFHLHCPIMSLPHLFDARLGSVSDRAPYLSVPEQLVDEWRERLSGATRFRIGIAWAGSKALRSDARRSIALHHFNPLRTIEHVQLVSLQKGDEATQLQDWGGEMVDWMHACSDLMDTAALIQNLDLVISVDTAVAHLAGALAKPIWLLNRYESEWRWGLGREDSPWYPTMRIFRQEEPDSWGSVVERIVTELRT